MRKLDISRYADRRSRCVFGALARLARQAPQHLKMQINFYANLKFNSGCEQIEHSGSKMNCNGEGAIPFSVALNFYRAIYHDAA
jgi:hypothetical protein